MLSSLLEEFLAEIVSNELKDSRKGLYANLFHIPYDDEKFNVKV